MTPATTETRVYNITKGVIIIAPIKLNGVTKSVLRIFLKISIIYPPLSLINHHRQLVESDI